MKNFIINTRNQTYQSSRTGFRRVEHVTNHTLQNQQHIAAVWINLPPLVNASHEN